MAARLLPVGNEPDVDHALFFAIFPDEEAARRIARTFRQVRNQHRLQGSEIRPDRYHMSLQGLGLATPEMVALARSIGDAVAFRPFDIGLNRIVTWNAETRRPHLVMEGNEAGLGGLFMLHERLRGALIAAFPGLKVGKFDPHLTLMYGNQPIEAEFIESISWTAGEFVLIESLQGLTRYNCLGRWRL